MGVAFSLIFVGLDKPVCPTTICLSCFLDIHATKNQSKRYPCRWIVMLSWVGIAKTLTGRGILDLSSNIHENTHDDSSIGVAFSLIFYSLDKRVCPKTVCLSCFFVKYGFQVRYNLHESAKTITGRGVLVSLARKVGYCACKTPYVERGFEAHHTLHLTKTADC